MSDAIKERGQALENEYFRRKEQELIEKMKAKMTAEKAAANAIKCVRCNDGILVEVDFENVKIDLCDKCGGAWLDAGELEALTKKENAGWLSRLLG
jgi:hypothetical protein